MAPNDNLLIGKDPIGERKSGTPAIICCEACYNTVDGKQEHCCKSFGCSTFFGCCGCFNTGKPGEPYKSCQTYTAVARSVVQLLIVVFGLLTIMEFGNMMDQSHFPGSGIELDRYDQGNDTDLIWDSFTDGYFLDVVDKGLDNENASECSNFITQTQLSGATSGILLCQGTANATQEWQTGWVSAYKCNRGSDDTLTMDDTCTGWSGNVAMFGSLTFYMLIGYAVLFLLATWIEHNNGYLYIDEYSIGDRLSCGESFRPDGQDKGVKTKKKVRGWCCRNTGERNVVWITLLWSAVGSLYAILAAGHWASMCDKLDTGLGRKMKIVDPETEQIVIPNGHACQTTGCESTFGSFFMWYSLTVVWMLLPQVFMFYFPALTPVKNKGKDTADDKDTADVEKAVKVDKLSDGGPNYSRHYTGHLKM